MVDLNPLLRLLEAHVAAERFLEAVEVCKQILAIDPRAKLQGQQRRVLDELDSCYRQDRTHFLDFLSAQNPDDYLLYWRSLSSSRALAFFVPERFPEPDKRVRLLLVILQSLVEYDPDSSVVEIASCFERIWRTSEQIDEPDRGSLRRRTVSLLVRQRESTFSSIEPALRHLLLKPETPRDVAVILEHHLHTLQLVDRIARPEPESEE